MLSALLQTDNHEIIESISTDGSQYDSLLGMLSLPSLYRPDFMRSLFQSYNPNEDPERTISRIPPGVRAAIRFVTEDRNAHTRQARQNTVEAITHAPQTTVLGRGAL